MPRAEGILIAGGYGEVGKQIAGDLAPDYPGRVIVGGRDESQALALAEALGNGTRALRLGAQTAATRLALDPPWVTALCAGMMQVGLGSLLRRAGIRRALVRLFGRLRMVYAGQDTFAVIVEVHGPSGKVRLRLAGRNESASTAQGATLMARGFYADEVRRPGVWLPEQVIEPGPFFEGLAARRLYVTRSG